MALQQLTKFIFLKTQKVICLQIRYRHEIVEFKNKIYVFGGGTATDNDGFEVIYAFDLATNSWINKATHGDSSIPIDETIQEQYPEPRKCHTCVQNGKCM